jgi:predicted RNA-binding Zn ribbon-like protein
VLSHARLRVSLGAGHDVARAVEVDEQSWLPAAIAGLDLLDLLRDRADRIRRCAHPDCVLWFLDTSRNGTRRWCSMAGCGNRAKAQRHYSRVRGAGDQVP